MDRQEPLRKYVMGLDGDTQGRKRADSTMCAVPNGYLHEALDSCGYGTMLTGALVQVAASKQCAEVCLERLLAAERQCPSNPKAQALLTAHYTYWNAQCRTRRDLVRELARMHEQAYPVLDKSLTEWRTDEQEAANDAYNETLQENAWQLDENQFHGDEQGRNPSQEAGITLLVYVDRGDRMALVFRGSHSTWDFNQDAVWWKDWLIAGMEERSLAWWTKLGNKPEDAASENPVAAFYTRSALNSAAVAFRAALAQKLTPTVGDNERATELGYAALIPLLLKDIDADMQLPALQRNETVLSGHSLGGALATLTSVYLYKNSSFKADTINFSALGVRCMIDAELSATEPLFAAGLYPWITSYADDYDVLGLFDYQVGRVCRFATDDKGVKACGKVFGLGTSLFFSFDVRTTTAADFKECRKFSHSIYHVVGKLDDDSVLNEDGTTALGCVEPVAETCPSYAVSAGFVFMVLLHVLVALVFCWLCIGLCGCCVATAAEWDRSDRWYVLLCCRCCRRKPRRVRSDGDSAGTELGDPKPASLSSSASVPKLDLGKVGAGSGARDSDRSSFDSDEEEGDATPVPPAADGATLEKKSSSKRKKKKKTPGRD